MSMCNIRLGSSAAALSTGWLVYSLNVPEPTTTTYSSFSRRVANQLGGELLRGFPNFTLFFDRLTVHQMNQLRKVIDDSVNDTGQIYATIDKSWNEGGADGPDNWIDVSGYPKFLSASQVRDQRGRAYESVTLTVVNLTTVNDPASGV